MCPAQVDAQCNFIYLLFFVNFFESFCVCFLCGGLLCSFCGRSSQLPVLTFPTPLHPTFRSPGGRGSDRHAIGCHRHPPASQLGPRPSLRSPASHAANPLAGDLVPDPTLTPRMPSPLPICPLHCNPPAPVPLRQALTAGRTSPRASHTYIATITPQLCRTLLWQPCCIIFFSCRYGRGPTKTHRPYISSIISQHDSVSAVHALLGR